MGQFKRGISLAYELGYSSNEQDTMELQFGNSCVFSAIVAQIHLHAHTLLTHWVNTRGFSNGAVAKFDGGCGKYKFTTGEVRSSV